MSQHAAKRWCLTVHVSDENAFVHYDDAVQVYCTLESMEMTGKLTYFVGQYERCPTTKKLHLQAYFSLPKKLRFKNVKALIDPVFNSRFWSPIHLEQANGTPVQCRDYCTKDDTREDKFRSMEFGTLPMKEKAEASVLIEEACMMLKGGASMSVVAEMMPTVVVRNIRGLTAFQKLVTPTPPPEHQPITVWVLWGEAGTGKTRAVFDWLRTSQKSYYRKSYSKGQPSWWDGYLNQEVLMLDDFEGERSGCPIDEFLNLLDGYGHTRAWPVKGAFTYVNFKTVFITSNTHPDSWYSTIPEKRAAVIRRVPNVYEVKAGASWRAIPMPLLLAHLQHVPRVASPVDDGASVSTIDVLSDSPPSTPALQPTRLFPPTPDLPDLVPDVLCPATPPRSPPVLRRSFAMMPGNLEQYLRDLDEPSD